MMDAFYIVATNPFHFSWTGEGGLSNMELCSFSFKDGLIYAREKRKFLAERDGLIYFVDSDVDAVKVELEPTGVKTNFKIKCTGGKYIRHKDSILCCDADNGADSTWIFMPAAYDSDHVFVIARYGEDVSWTRYLPGRVIIYNKGKDNIPDFQHRGNVCIERLENIGREGHTYLNYIITHYDSLPGRVVFLQGDSFPHSENILELCCMLNDFCGFQSMSSWYTAWSEPMIHVTKSALKTINGAIYALYPVDKNGAPLEYHDTHWQNCTSSYFRVDGSYNPNNNPLSEFLNRVQMLHKIRPIYFLCHGALFSVSRDDILINTKDEYIRLITELTKYCSHGGVEGFIIERLWYTLLTHKNNIECPVSNARLVHYITHGRTQEANVLKNILPLAGNTLKAYTRFIFHDKEYINHIKDYASLMRMCKTVDNRNRPIVANYDCMFIDSTEIATARFNAYYKYLIEHAGEWDLFLGAPRDIRPVRIVSREPFIIECSRATSFTFVIHSPTTVQYIHNYAASITLHSNAVPIDIACADNIYANGGKIWVPYPLLCCSTTEPNYATVYNDTLKKFIDDVDRG